VRAAVESGDLPEGRYESYQKLVSEREYQRRQVDERALLEHKRKWKVVTKAANKHIKAKRDERQ